MRGIYNYIPETNHVYRVYNTVSILSLQYMVIQCYFPRYFPKYTHSAQHGYYYYYCYYNNHHHHHYILLFIFWLKYEGEVYYRLRSVKKVNILVCACCMHSTASAWITNTVYTVYWRPCNEQMTRWKMNWKKGKAIWKLSALNQPVFNMSRLRNYRYNLGRVHHLHVGVMNSYQDFLIRTFTHFFKPNYVRWTMRPCKRPWVSCSNRFNVGEPDAPLLAAVDYNTDFISNFRPHPTAINNKYYNNKNNDFLSACHRTPARALSC